MTDESKRLRDALAARYELGDELGRGGMAIVFGARDVRLDRQVAIKVLKPGILTSTGVERFLQEIQIQARLQHPNILPLHDSGEVGGTLYYVMPRVSGETLRERLDREGQLPIDEAIQIAREVAYALSYAHTQGVVHRDIKPSNILLSSGHAIVSDFGIARALSNAAGVRLTESGLVIGTPEYMSPEQGAGDKDIDERTDIYSLGCVLFEMMAGEPPYMGRTPQAIIARHIHERLPALEVVRPGVPHHVVKAVETCLAKARADRFASAEEFVEALDSPLEVEGRRAVGLRAGAVGLLVALSAIVSWFVFRPPPVALDSKKIVVFPLEEHGLPASAAGAGYDVALMIELALDHSEPLRWIDGRKRLEAPIRNDIGLLTPDLAREVSLERNAGYYIDGVVRHGPDSATVMLQLHDVAGDTLVTRESATAPYDEVTLAQLGLRAVRNLLPELLDPGHEVDLTPLTDRSPASVALWIQGEGEYRLVHFRRALELYERALAEDSALVIAAIGGAQAAHWLHEPEQAASLVSVALASDTLLPARYQHLALGLQEYYLGQADSAVARFEQALADDSDWPAALRALGEVAYHLLPARPRLDSLAEAAFDRALQSDSSFAPALYHLSQMAIRRGEFDRARALISQLAEVNPEFSFDRELDLALRCVVEGDVDWEAAAESNPFVTLTAAGQLAVGALQSACAQDGYRAVLSSESSDATERWGALLGLQGLLVAEGRDAAVVALLDSTVAAGTAVAVLLYLVDTLAGARLEHKAAETDSLLASLFGEEYLGINSPAQLYLVGVWQVHQGDLGRVETISQALEERAKHSGDRPTKLFSSALAAHLPFLRGDTAETVNRLRKTGPNAPREILDWDLSEALAYERLRLAELLLARGEYGEAYHVGSGFDHPGPIVFLPFVPRSLAIRYHAAQAMKRSDLANKARGRLTNLGRADLIHEEP